MKCVLVGNYGVGNIGDEALQQWFLSAFPEITWIVVSAQANAPNEVPRLPLGIRSFFSPWIKTLQAISHADALVFGGGSLFTDIESVWACVIWRAYAVVAAFFRVPILLAFQGAGPWKTSLGLHLSKKTYQQAIHVSVRDTASLARLQAFGLTKAPVVTVDPAFAAFAEHAPKPASRRLVIIPRTNSDDTFFRIAQEKLTEHFQSIRIVLMHPDIRERRVGERLRVLTGERADIVDIYSVQQFLDEVSAASEVLSQRYHGALAAVAMKIPVTIVSQNEGDKLDALRKTMTTGSHHNEWLMDIQKGREALQRALRSC